jgi:hypothetical protein
MTSGELAAPSLPEELSPFAREVATAVLSGRPFGDKTLPAEDEQALVVPGTLIRDLVLGALGQLAEPEIHVHGVVIAGDVDLAYCEWRGELDLSHCRLDGVLNISHTAIHGRVCLDGAHLSELRATYAHIEGPLYFRRGHSDGGVYALGARITGSLNLGRTRLWAPEERPNRCALELFRAHLGDLFLGRSELHGGMYANGMTVDRNVRLQSALVVSRDAMGWRTGVDSADGGISLVGASIGAALYLSWREPERDPLQLKGRLIMTRLTCVTFRVRASEIENVQLSIDHLSYTRLLDTTPEQWLAVLERTTPTRSQPYVRLADYCVEQGRTDLQRRVLIALQRRITAELPEGSWERWRRRLWAATVAYGYRPARAIWWLLACTALCIGMLLVGGDFLVHAPEAGTAATRGVPNLMQAVPIAMDNLLPFAGLSVTKQWSAEPSDVAQTLWLTLFVALKLLGWGLAALGLVSVTGIVKKP